MPNLEKQVDLFPETLLESPAAEDSTSRWAAVYTLSRREKDFARKLYRRDVPFYVPTIANEKKSPAGRLRTSYLPLFSNYVFVHANATQRVWALETNCVSRWIDVPDGERLRRDLLRVQNLILTGLPLKLEPRLEVGAMVRVKSGALEGQEGVVIRQQGQSRLIIAVDFLQQGASVLIDDADLEPLTHSN